MRGGEPDHAVVVGDPATLEPLGVTVDDMLPLEEGIARSLRWYRDHLAEFH
jgi:hypothetical protein